MKVGMQRSRGATSRRRARCGDRWMRRTAARRWSAGREGSPAKMGLRRGLVSDAPPPTHPRVPAPAASTGRGATRKTDERSGSTHAQMCWGFGGVSHGSSSGAHRREPEPFRGLPVWQRSDFSGSSSGSGFSVERLLYWSGSCF